LTANTQALPAFTGGLGEFRIGREIRERVGCQTACLFDGGTL